MIYHPETHSATWNTPSMLPYEAIGLYYEVAVTPTSASIGTIPPLLSYSSVSGKDPHVEREVSASSGSIQASLATDSIGKTKGVLIQ